MPKRTEFSDIVDGVLRLLAVGSVTGAMLIAPNAVRALDKPLQKYFKKLDQRSRQREYNRMLTYLHQHKLVTGRYDHGLEITDKALKRLEKAEFESLHIKKQDSWDKTWRIIIYDIPESHKIARNKLAFKLRQLGCQQLQRSVWIHPFPCESELNTVAHKYGVARYITYLETTRINNQKALVFRFSNLLD